MNSAKEVKMMTKTTPRFSPEEEARIQQEVRDQQAKAREAEIQAEIRNRIADENRNKPGYKYY